jgi:hypothetical protein
MEILKKMNEAIESIKSQNLKKKGKNKFTNADYYTPEQVSELVIGACHKVKLFPKFDLVRNELGITGTLSVYDIESDETPVIFEMASDIPNIKAANISQQLGGAMTYTKRYLFMNAFDIADNNLDFDTTENTKKAQSKMGIDSAVIASVKNAIGQCKTLADLQIMWTNNRELQSEKFFIDAKNNRKKILEENGISN